MRRLDQSFHEETRLDQKRRRGKRFLLAEYDLVLDEGGHFEFQGGELKLKNLLRKW